MSRWILLLSEEYVLKRFNLCLKIDFEISFKQHMSDRPFRLYSCMYMHGCSLCYDGAQWLHGTGRCSSSEEELGESDC